LIRSSRPFSSGSLNDKKQAGDVSACFVARPVNKLSPFSTRDMTSVKKLLLDNKVAAIGMVLALLLASWLGWYFSARQVIKRQLVAMSWDISREPQESTMETAIKMRSIKAVLAAECRVIVPESRLDEKLERDMGIMYLMHYRNRYQMLVATFEKLHIDFAADDTASVQAVVLLKRQKQDASLTEVSAPVKLIMQKIDGEWLLTQAEIASVLLAE
jgi:ketosteroid isomerase-like protein